MNLLKLNTIHMLLMIQYLTLFVPPHHPADSNVRLDLFKVYVTTAPIKRTQHQHHTIQGLEEIIHVPT